MAQARSELELLAKNVYVGGSPEETHAFRSAPVVTRDALLSIGLDMFPQRALYGNIIAQHVSNFATAPTRLNYISTLTLRSVRWCVGFRCVPNIYILLVICADNGFIGVRKEPLRVSSHGELPH